MSLDKVKEIHLTHALSKEEGDRLMGEKIDDSSYDTLIEESCNVYKPNGDMLIAFRRNVLPPDMCREGYEMLKKFNSAATNRGTATGKGSATNRITGKGYRTNTSSVPGRIAAISGIIGNFDRTARFPYCRQTAFLIQEGDKWSRLLPLIRSIDGVFKASVPERYENQRKMILKTPPEFCIPGTVFTTLTVNRNFQTAVHKDAGDLKDGFGVMTALRGGVYSGGYTVFPQYRVAANMQNCDVLLADVHEWHGNTPLVGKPGRYNRISLVLYYRTNMWRCSSPEEEVEIAKNRKYGDPLYSGEYDKEDEDGKCILVHPNAPAPVSPPVPVSVDEK